jgi:hypothetical protein
MTSREPRWDLIGLIFHSKEALILNFEAQDLEMIQVHKRLEGLWQFEKQSESTDEYDNYSRMSIQDLEEHHHKLPTISIHNVEVLF